MATEVIQENLAFNASFDGNMFYNDQFNELITKTISIPLSNLENANDKSQPAIPNNNDNNHDNNEQANEDEQLDMNEIWKSISENPKVMSKMLAASKKKIILES